MKKFTILLVSAALVAGSPALGGEIGGNDQYVPGGDNGASACSYSGLNDTPWDRLGFTQTFAAVLKAMGINASRFFNAGLFCKGNVSH